MGSPLGGGLASSREPKRWATGGSHVLRLTAKLLLVFRMLGLSKGDGMGLEAEGRGLRPFKAPGVQDGRAVAEAGAEAWLRGLGHLSGEDVAGCSDRK